MADIEALTVVSATELALRLGVKTETVHMWRFRGLLPEPDWLLAVGPIWKWVTVERWAKETGRLK